MLGNDHQTRRLRFSVFEVDLNAGELRKHGMKIRIQEQPFQLLATLIEHAGEIVSREDLQKKLWAADTFVDFDHGLNKAINKIRDALGDSAESPRFVETVTRRGYRFLADVKISEMDPAGGATLADSAAIAAEAVGGRDSGGEDALPKYLPVPMAWKVSAILLLVLCAALAIWKLHSLSDAAPVIRSLAVLPLESLSNDA